MDGAVSESVATASPITSLLDNFLDTGLLLGDLSRFGLEPALKGGVQLHRATYFVGCCGQDVAPLETLVGHFLHVRLFQLQQIPSVCVIARRLAKGLSDLCPRTIDLRAAEHLAIAKLVRSIAGVPTEVVFDDQLGDTSPHGAFPGCFPTDSIARHERIRYYVGQHGILQAARRQLNVQLKTGWSFVPSTEEFRALVQSWLVGRLPKSACEARFDALTVAADRAQNASSPMCFMYTSPTFTFCSKHPVAVPYAARKPSHGELERVLLQEGQSLSAAIPDPRRCLTASCKDRAIAAMNQLDHLIRLIGDTLPGFFEQARDGSLCDMELEISNCLNTWHELIEVHGLRSREVREQATRLRQLRVEYASALRAHLIPRVRRVVEVFGI